MRGSIEDILEEADHLSRALHEHREALDLLDEYSLAIAQSGADAPARIKLQRAAILERQGNQIEAARRYGEALEMLGGTRDEAMLATCLEGLSRSQVALGERDKAQAHLKEALNLSVALGDRMAEERLCRQLGRLAEESHRLREARSWYRKSVNLAREAENWFGVVSDLTSLARIGAKVGEHQERERLDLERDQLINELGEIAFAGPSASPRSEVMVRARDLLCPQGLDVTDSPSESDPLATALDQYHRATALRKSGQHREAVDLYHPALAHYAKSDRPKEMIACLNGLGISYRLLAQKRLMEDIVVLRSTATMQESISLTNYLYQLLRREPLGLAEKARACHVWALELQKGMDSLAGQANQISNLALVEEFLGNLDTARRYQSWTLHAHCKSGQPTAATIDLASLARLERALGDEDAARMWEREAEEVADESRR